MSGYGAAFSGTSVTMVDRSAGKYFLNVSWSTVGVGPNLLEASWEALTDSAIWGLRNRRVAPR